VPLLAALLLSKLSAESQMPTVTGAEDILKIVHGSETPTVVHFWAGWCEQCLHELPEIRRLEQSLADLKAKLVLVSLDKDASLPVSVLGRFGIGNQSLMLLLDAPDPKPVTARFNAHWQAELPATFVVLQSGAVAASHLGTTPVDVILKEVRAQIAKSRPGEFSPARRTQ
jgi:thiol-disulfide isomerase/thioredoxin